MRRRREEKVPIGYVFMVGQRPRGPLRASYDEAMRDAVEAGEAYVCLQNRATFLSPLAWIAPIYP